MFPYPCRRQKGKKPGSPNFSEDITNTVEKEYICDYLINGQYFQMSSLKNVIDVNTKKINPFIFNIKFLL